MSMRLLDTANADVGSVILKVSTGKFKHFALVFEGTNDAGATLALANLGSLLAVKKTRNFISNIKLTNLMHIANAMGGVPVFSSSIGAAASFIVPIFCYDPSAPDNVMDVSEEDAMTFTISNLAAFTTAIVSGTFYLYGDDADGVQNYIPLFNQVTEVIGGAGNVVKTLTGENFVRLFINGMDDTDISRIAIRQDGITKVNATRLAVLYMSNFLSNIESVAASSPLGTSYETGLVFAHIPLSYGKPSELISDNLEYDLTVTGAASPELISVCLDFTPNEQEASQATSEAKLNTKLQNKIEHGKGRPVNALKTMARIPAMNEAVITSK